MQAARVRACITLTHGTLVRDLLAQGALVSPFAHRTRLTEGYFLISPAEYAANPAATAFRDWIDQEMAAFQTTRRSEGASDI